MNLEITIPKQYVKLCSDWHSGQSSMMYAISSIGDLQLGTIRPRHQDEDRFMTDEEWLIQLWEELELEIRDARKVCKKFSDSAKLVKFQLYVKSVIARLKGE